MKSILKISLVILLVLFVLILIYINIKKYTSNNNLEVMVQEASIIEKNVDDMKVNAVYNMTSFNVIATKKVPQSVFNSTTGNSSKNNVVENDLDTHNDISVSIDNEHVEEDVDYIKDINLVNLEITNCDFENSNLILTITDNNEIAYSWNEQYKIEKKNEEGWEELNRTNPEKSLLFKKIYIRNENNQIDFKINWINDYGELDIGIYRIIKESEGNKFYSNEFEIK